MGCACNPNTPEHAVNLENDQDQQRNYNDDGMPVAAKTGNFAVLVSLEILTLGPKRRRTHGIRNPNH